MKVQGYEQLRLHDVDWSYYDNRDGKKWAGKVVDKVGFVNRGSHSEQMLLILFTDKTFICVGLEYKEDNSDEMILNDNWIYDQKVYHDSLEVYHSYVDKDGKVSFDLWLQMLIDMGIYHLSDEEVKRIKAEHARKEEERDYANYLRLKEKFEGKEKAKDE